MRQYRSQSIEPALVIESPLARLGDFVELTKPRLNFLVVVTTMVGFYMAADARVDWLLMLATLAGTFLTAGAASAFNQLIERDYDALMPRTRNRPLPAGRLSEREALAFGLLLTVLGLGLLAVSANVLTALLGAITVGCYVFVYTPMKRVSTLNTIVGAIPGAIPPMMGWAACRGSLSIEAFALFGILFLWQMPHFLSIAILYRKDYADAGYRMLPVVDEGLTITSRQIVTYTLALIPASLLPTALGLAGTLYFAAAAVLGTIFLALGILWTIQRTRSAARRVFFGSILYLPALFAVLMIDKVGV